MNADWTRSRNDVRWAVRCCRVGGCDHVNKTVCKCSLGTVPLLVAAARAGPHVASALGATPTTTFACTPSASASTLRARLDSATRVRRAASHPEGHNSQNQRLRKSCAQEHRAKDCVTLVVRTASAPYHALRSPQAATSELRLPLESTENTSWS